MRKVDVFQRKGTIYVNGLSGNVDGIWLALPPIHTLPESCTDAELGSTVRQALFDGRLRLIFDARIPLTTTQDAANVSSWSAFAKGATMMGVEHDGHQMTFTPWENRGARMGFAPLPELESVCAAEMDDAELGRAVRAALASSR